MAADRPQLQFPIQFTLGNGSVQLRWCDLFVLGVVFKLAYTATYPFIGEMWKYVFF